MKAGHPSHLPVQELATALDCGITKKRAGHPKTLNPKSNHEPGNSFTTLKESKSLQFNPQPLGASRLSHGQQGQQLLRILTWPCSLSHTAASSCISFIQPWKLPAHNHTVVYCLLAGL